MPHARVSDICRFGLHLKRKKPTKFVQASSCPSAQQAHCAPHQTGSTSEGPDQSNTPASLPPGKRSGDHLVLALFGKLKKVGSPLRNPEYAHGAQEAESAAPCPCPTALTPCFLGQAAVSHNHPHFCLFLQEPGEGFLRRRLGSSLH